MIVEHDFITTRPAGEALESARELMADFGFSLLGPAGVESVQFTRGRKDPRRAVYCLQEQPQRAAVTFDRGRITVAASIEPYGKPRDLHRELLLTLAMLLEAGITVGADPAKLHSRWEDLHQRIRRDNFRRRLPRDLLVVSFLLLVMGALVFLSWRT